MSAAGPPEAADGGFAAALASWPGGVALLTIADGRDDIGATVSACCPVSLDPPLLLVSLMASSYPAEVLGRAVPFALTLLTAGQRVLAGRFASPGRPSARVLLEGTPHARGEFSRALIPAGGLAAFECEVSDRLSAGDHLVIVGVVTGVPYASGSGEPLIRFRNRYLG